LERPTIFVLGCWKFRFGSGSLLEALREEGGDKRKRGRNGRSEAKMLLLRGARAASAASTAVAAGAGRSISIRLTAVAALSSGGRRRKGQRRGVAKPPSPSPPPPPPPPQPLPRHGETPSSNKKSGARTSVEAKKSHPAEMERARGPQSPERGEERKGRTPPP